MQTFNLNLQTPNNNFIIEALENAFNEFSAMYHHIKLKASYEKSFDDESYFAFKSIPLPWPYQPNDEDDFLEQNMAANEEFEKDFSDLLRQFLKQDWNLTEYSHYLIINDDLETLEIHFNDDVLNIIYHYTGQW